VGTQLVVVTTRTVGFTGVFLEFRVVDGKIGDQRSEVELPEAEFQR
jgi:hypothetical protein